MFFFCRLGCEISFLNSDDDTDMICTREDCKCDSGHCEKRIRSFRATPIRKKLERNEKIAVINSSFSSLLSIWHSIYKENENESAIEVPPPPYSEILWSISIIGATFSLDINF